jgi:hypothetical protein
MFTFSSNNTTAEYRNAVEIVGLAINEKYGHTAQRDVDLDIDVTMYASGNQDSPSAFSDIGVGNGLRVTFNHAHKNFTTHKYNADGEFVGVKMARKNGALVFATIAQAMALSSVDAKDRFYTSKDNGKSGSNKKVRAQAEDKNSGKQSGRDAMENFGLKLLPNRRGFEIADVETYKQLAEEFADEIDTIRKLKISDDYTPRAKADTEAKPKNIKVICDTDEECSFMKAVKSFVIENGKASEIKDWHCPNGHLLIDATTKTTSDVVTEAEKVLATA